MAWLPLFTATVLWGLHLAAAVPERWDAGQLHSTYDSFDEQVELHALSQSHYQLSFKAEQGSWLGAYPPTTFPWAIRNLAAATPLTQLSIHLTRGRWDYRSWGQPRLQVHPPGALISVMWAAPEHHAAHWTRLMHRLSGLLCASLNLAAHPDSASVDHMAHLSAGQPHNTNATRSYHVAVLPREAVCTENLSPWVRLLPCQGAAGLAGLLADKGQILGGDHHTLSLQLSVVPGIAHDAPVRLDLSLTFTCVLRIPTPHPHPTAPSTSTGVLAVKHVLPASQHVTACSAARSSQVLLLAVGGGGGGSGGGGQQHSQVVELFSDPGSDQQGSHMLGDLQLQPAAGTPTPPAVLLHTALHGSGLHTGQLVVVIEQLVASRVAAAGHWPAGVHPWEAAGGVGGRGAGPDSWGVVCVQQWVPWVLRVWLHTRVFHVDQQEVAAAELVVWERVDPAVDRGRPLQLTTCLRLPPTAHRVSITTHTNRAFLTLAEHPPDAHRGWDVPPARLTYYDTTACAQASGKTPSEQPSAPCLQQVLGPSVLVRLATADVAMPYNVICLTSTVLAISFGAALNILVQRTTAGSRSASVQGKAC